MNSITGASHQHEDLDFIGILSTIHAEFLGRECSAVIYAADHRHQLVRITETLAGSFDPFPVEKAQRTIFLEMGGALITLDPERIISAARWIESFGEPAPRLVLEAVRADGVLELEVPVDPGRLLS